MSLAKDNDMRDKQILKKLEEINQRLDNFEKEIKKSYKAGLVDGFDMSVKLMEEIKKMGK